MTHKVLPTTPSFPDTTWTTKIKRVAASARGQYVVTGAWSVESDTQGYTSPRYEPAQFEYVFWPVKEGVVWFKDGNDPYWAKLRATR